MSKKYSKIGEYPIIGRIFGNMNFSQAISEYAHLPLTRQLMLHVLKDYRRPNDKISELIRQEQLISLTKGLYVIGPSFAGVHPSPFLMANYLWGPSYVSLETALSYWGLIPERTFEVSSCTMKLSKKYNTALGRFSFYNLSMPYYTFGIRSVQMAANQVVLMASPEKALCDKIVLTPYVNLRSTRETVDFLLEDLRIDEGKLLELNQESIAHWTPESPKRKSLEMLVKTLQKL